MLFSPNTTLPNAFLDTAVTAAPDITPIVPAAAVPTADATTAEPAIAAPTVPPVATDNAVTPPTAKPVFTSPVATPAIPPAIPPATTAPIIIATNIGITFPLGSEYFNGLSNLAFFQCLKRFRGEEENTYIKGLKKFSELINKNKIKEKGEDYIKHLKYFLDNYEIILSNKKPRGPKTTNE